MNGVKIYKKGDKIKLPIAYNFDYKVKTSFGYEKPLYRQDNFYKENIIEVEFSNGIILPMTREHRHDVITEKGTEPVLSVDLKVGMQSITDTGETVTITSLKEKPYEGICCDFTMPNDVFYANGIQTRNCRLRLDLRELTKKNGSLFGSGENTGSIGVVTLNMPQIGYLSHTEDELFQRIENMMTIAKESLELKRTILKKWYDDGLFPYTKRYLKAGFDNHFSTIGVLGFNELCRNYFRNTKKKDLDIATKEGHALTIKILEFMREKCKDFQEETGNLYNLESTPAESTCFRLAKHDKEQFSDIITAGTIAAPYYTNSSNLPVGFTDDPWVAIKHQESVQKLYTGGCIPLDTKVNVEGMGDVDFIEVFKKVGLDVSKMQEGRAYKMKEEVKLLAWDERAKEKVYQPIEQLIYKGYSPIWEIVDEDGKVLLECREDHKIYNVEHQAYTYASKIKEEGMLALREDGSSCRVYSRLSDDENHIFDMQIEGKNYFSNGILSHNTVLHTYMSESVDDWQKVRDFVKKVMYNTELPYITLTPSFSICEHHGYLRGDVHGVCPLCHDEATENYQRKLDELQAKKDSLLG